jgi:hypothetical protein
MMKKLGMVFLAACLGSCDHFNPGDGKIEAHVFFQTKNLAGITVALVQLPDTEVTDSSGTARLLAPPGNYTVRVFGVPVSGQVVPHIDLGVQVRENETTGLEINDSLVAGDVLVGDSVQLSVFASSTDGSPTNPISFHVQVANMGTTLWLAEGDCEQAVPGQFILIYSSQSVYFYTFPYWALACDPVSVSLGSGQRDDGLIQYFGDLYTPPQWFIISSPTGDYAAVATFNASDRSGTKFVSLRSRPIAFHWSQQ